MNCAAFYRMSTLKRDFPIVIQTARNAMSQKATCSYIIIVIITFKPVTSAGKSRFKVDISYEAS